jgi:hypothetical protein
MAITRTYEVYKLFDLFTYHHHSLQKKLINIYSILKKMAKSSVSVVLVLFIVTLAANGTELNKNGAGVGNEKTLGWILYCNELYQK